LTTQYLEEADRLAERMAVVDHGRVIAEGTSRELKSSVGGSALRVQLLDPARREEAQGLITQLLGDGIVPNTDPTSLSIKVAGAAQAADVLAAMSRANIQLTDFSLGAPSLDDVFFTLTGHAAETPIEAANEVKS
jgi:ABC-2 type transport system ATP-binding protein